jgi:Phytanoyl-CoA dioxygenase (PhyH)
MAGMAETSSSILNPLHVGRGVAQRLALWRDAGAPKYHTGPAWAAVMGLQLLRAMHKNLAYGARRAVVEPEIEQAVSAMLRDGVVLIPDFLPAEQFAAVRAEFDAMAASGRFSRSWPEHVDVAEDYCAVKPNKPSAISQYLVRNPFLTAVAAAVTRRAIRIVPRVSARAWRRISGRQRAHLTGAAYIHADIHYPTCKAWLYLNDIDEGNGAFIFCKGSQKMTPARLAYEYDASIRVARDRHTSSNNGLLRKPTQRQISAMKLRETSMCGKANTLLIANTQGFHRMGEFSDERPREKIYICFREVESAQNRRTPKAR